MAIYKTESNNTWYVMVRYQDWTGERKQKCKRGFATKREAAQWEQQFILQKKVLWLLWSSVFVTLVAKKEHCSYALIRAS